MPKPATFMTEQELFVELGKHGGHSIRLHDFGQMRSIENPGPGKFHREWFCASRQLICDDCDVVLKNFYNREVLDDNS